MATMNVDPEKQNDPFYRYKMSKVQVKVEGNGNGIKTVVSNVQEISGQLGRNVEYLMKFFAHELAATQKFKDEKWILTGNFSQDNIQKCIFDFIVKFVLCKKCRNPETVIQIDEKKDCYLNCKACSRVTPISMKEKLCNVFVKDQKPVDSKGKKNQKKEKTEDEKEEDKYNKIIRQAGEEDEIDGGEAKEVELPNPVHTLRDYLLTNPTDREVDEKVFDIKGDYGLSDKAVVNLVFEALFDENVVEQISPQHKRMKRFLKKETEKDVIINLMLLCVDKGIEGKFKIALKKFYDTEVLGEDTILQWYEGKPSKSLGKDAQKSFKESVALFIEWLKAPEEEDSEGDEDSS